MIIKYYEVNESSLSSKEYSPGTLYYCSDTGNVFFDSTLEEKRIQMSTGIKLCSNLPIAPVPGVLYCNVTTGRLSTFIDSEWVYFGGSEPGGSVESSQTIIINSITVSNGTATVNDSRITEENTAEFIVDPSIADLATNVSVSCSNGSATITLTSNYDIYGMLVIY